MIAAREIVLPLQMERIARLALEKPHVVAFGTTGSVAAAASASSATVVRLARYLGFESFREFRAFFQRHLRESSLINGKCLPGAVRAVAPVLSE
jgi:DNA-binding MurR/RpiR family transcriptional regulator